MAWENIITFLRNMLLFCKSFILLYSNELIHILEFPYFNFYYYNYNPHKQKLLNVLNTSACKAILKPETLSTADFHNAFKMCHVAVSGVYSFLLWVVFHCVNTLQLVHSPVDRHLAPSRFWLLWIQLARTILYKSFFKHVFLWGKYLGVEMDSS